MLLKLKGKHTYSLKHPRPGLHAIALELQGMGPREWDLYEHIIDEGEVRLQVGLISEKGLRRQRSWTKNWKISWVMRMP